MSQTFLTVEKLAKKMDLRPSTIRRWVKQGKIPVLRLSATVVRFVWADVFAALRRLDAGRRADTGPESASSTVADGH